jgi:hypothetical protein
VNHQTPRRASTSEVNPGLPVAPSQIQETLGGSAEGPLANGQAERQLYLAGGVYARRKLPRRSQTSLSRKRRSRKVWATRVHNPQVRRALKRTPGTRGHRVAVPIARTCRHELLIRGSQVRILPGAPLFYLQNTKNSCCSSVAAALEEPNLPTHLGDRGVAWAALKASSSSQFDLLPSLWLPLHSLIGE